VTRVAKGDEVLSHVVYQQVSWAGVMSLEIVRASAVLTSAEFAIEIRIPLRADQRGFPLDDLLRFPHHGKRIDGNVALRG
jgi:hypothetical protein